MLDRSSAFESEGQADETGDKTKRRPSALGQLVAYARNLSWIFMATVLLPTSCAILYFGFLASDVYISESRFVVRSPDKPAGSGIGFLLKSAGFSSAGDEVFAAQDFVTSRDALQALNRGDVFRHAYSNPSISYLDRFGTWLAGTSFEDLYKLYRSRIRVDHDSSSSITTVYVRAYSAKDARRFNEQLLSMAESTVNKLNTRGRQDLIRFATTEVLDAKTKAEEAALALSEYRNQRGVVDPERQAAVQLQMISKLQDELIATRMQLLQLRSFTPQNPQIAVLETKVGGLTNAIDVELGKVAGDQSSLSSAAARYQRLMLDNQFAEKQLGAAMGSLEDAKNEARRKQAYVERVVAPNLPDEALEPRRMMGIFMTFALGLVAWGVLSMLLAGIMEHKD
jgi:capsular polysaccharide transport system permease protein